MDNEKQKDYTRRVSQANRTELVVITYDIILDYIRDALDAVERDVPEDVRSSAKQARRFLEELISVLDFRYSVSKQLLSLYGYVQRILVGREMSGRDRGLEDAGNVIFRLREAFAQIVPQDASGAVMENTQTIFAGLTYGKGSLNETEIGGGASKRGFFA